MSFRVDFTVSLLLALRSLIVYRLYINLSDHVIRFILIRETKQSALYSF